MSDAANIIQDTAPRAVPALDAEDMENAFAEMADKAMRRGGLVALSSLDEIMDLVEALETAADQAQRYANVPALRDPARTRAQTLRARLINLGVDVDA